MDSSNFKNIDFSAMAGVVINSFGKFTAEEWEKFCEKRRIEDEEEKRIRDKKQEECNHNGEVRFSYNHTIYCRECGKYFDRPDGKCKTRFIKHEKYEKLSDREYCNITILPYCEIADLFSEEIIKGIEDGKTIPELAGKIRKAFNLYEKALSIFEEELSKAYKGAEKAYETAKEDIMNKILDC